MSRTALFWRTTCQLILSTVVFSGCMGPPVTVTYLDKPDLPPEPAPRSSLKTLSGRYALEGVDHFNNQRFEASIESEVWIGDRRIPGGDSFVIALQDDRMTLSIYSGDQLLRVKSLQQGRDFKLGDAGIEMDQTSEDFNGNRWHTIKYHSHLLLYRATNGALIIRAHREIDHVNFPPVPWKTDYTLDEWCDFPAKPMRELDRRDMRSGGTNKAHE